MSINYNTPFLQRQACFSQHEQPQNVIVWKCLFFQTVQVMINQQRWYLPLGGHHMNTTTKTWIAYSNSHLDASKYQVIIIIVIVNVFIQCKILSGATVLSARVYMYTHIHDEQQPINQDLWWWKTAACGAGNLAGLLFWQKKCLVVRSERVRRGLVFFCHKMLVQCSEFNSG